LQNYSSVARGGDSGLAFSGFGLSKSEYFYKGQPAKFRCSFLIHLEPAGNSSTKVEVFEYQPTIWAGEYFGFSAHAVLPTTLHDIRPVQPTTTDRKALLTRIQNAYLSKGTDNVR